MKKLISLCIILICVAGCWYATRDHYYISLENVAEIKVINRDKLNSPGLHGGTIVPTEYELEKEKYSLKFRLTGTTVVPHVKISIEDTQRELHLQHRRDITSRSEQGILCSSYYKDKNSLSIIYFTWSSGCISDDYKKVISFDVIDDSGALIEEENIYFEIVRDGKYRVKQAI